MSDRPLGRWPTANQIAFSHAAAEGLVFRCRKGVIRYRNDDEADEDMRRMQTEALIEQAVNRAKARKTA